jgi:hypothetical protein
MLNETWAMSYKVVFHVKVNSGTYNVTGGLPQALLWVRKSPLL